MPLQEGPSIGMSTLTGDDSKSSIVFVEDKDAQIFDQLYDAHQEPYMTNAYPERLSQDLNFASDSNLDEYLKNPSDALKVFLDNFDTKNTDNKKLIEKLESELEKLLGVSFKGVVANSSVKNLELALKTAAKYKSIKEASELKVTSKDDRIFKLAKILIEK